MFEFRLNTREADILAETLPRALPKRRAKGERQSFAGDARAVEEEDRAGCTPWGDGKLPAQFPPSTGTLMG